MSDALAIMLDYLRIGVAEIIANLDVLDDLDEMVEIEAVVQEAILSCKNNETVKRELQTALLALQKRMAQLLIQKGVINEATRS